MVGVLEEGDDVAFHVGALSGSGLIACAAPADLAAAAPLYTLQDWAGRTCPIFTLAGLRSQWTCPDKTGQVIRVPVCGCLHIDDNADRLRAALLGQGAAVTGRIGRAACGPCVR